jgi:hypothetical protein
MPRDLGDLAVPGSDLRVEFGESLAVVADSAEEVGKVIDRVQHVCGKRTIHEIRNAHTKELLAIATK